MSHAVEIHRRQSGLFKQLMEHFIMLRNTFAGYFKRDAVRFAYNNIPFCVKINKSYRFSLSWDVQSEDSILAGEFLESLGNKKSRFLVSLVADYVRDHPNDMDADGTIRVVLESSDGGQQMIEKVKALVVAELEGKILLQQPKTAASQKPPQEEADVGLSFMLIAWINGGRSDREFDL